MKRCNDDELYFLNVTSRDSPFLHGTHDLKNVFIMALFSREPQDIVFSLDNTQKKRLRIKSLTLSDDDKRRQSQIIEFF